MSKNDSMLAPRELYLDITPMSFAVPQRIAATEEATRLGRGVHMAVGNSTTRFYASRDVAVGKVMVTMPRVYKGIPEYITTLDSPEQDWCPREDCARSERTCPWCGLGPDEAVSA